MAVESLRQAGYTVVDACQALGISRSSYYASKQAPRVKVRDGDRAEDDLVAMITELKEKHPFWGYRRVWAWLRHREGILVNRKRVYRLMKKHGLMVPQAVHKAKRKTSRPKPRAERPREVWGIDMTKFMVNSLGWVYLVIVLDWFTRKVVGWRISLRSKTEDWKLALEMALNREFPYGVRGCGLKLVSDNGSQPTSVLCGIWRA